MTETAAAAVVRIERVMAAPPDRVYAAWLDPALIGRWLSPAGHAEADVDARVGGRFVITMVEGDSRIEHTGEYRELVPGRRLVFTWTSPYTGPEPSVVTVDLEPTGAGTALTLVHERLPSDQVAPHGGGWGRILDRLAAVLAGATGGGS